MFAKWKSKLKAAIKEAKDKRKEKHNRHSSPDALVQPVGAIDKQSDGLSRPYGLGGRRSLDAAVASQGALGQTGVPANNSTAAAGGSAGAGVQQPQPGSHPAEQQHVHAARHEQVPVQQRQLDQQHANIMAQHQHQQQQQHMHGHVAGLRPVDCADRNTHGVEELMKSCPGSPSQHASTMQGTLQDSSAPAGHASTAAASTQHAEGGSPAGGVHASAAAAGDNAEHGSTLSSTAMQQHRLDASRTPKDEELGSCPPYAAKAVWGLRYTMEDKWAAVPNLIQVPIVLTSALKKSKANKASGCGCMIPAATKVLSKVSPSSRLNSISSGGGGKDAKAAAAAQGAKPGLEKPSPDQQRLIGQGVCSSDEQGLWEAASGPEGAGAAPLPGMDALHYFGVFDGHGGADAARHCAQRMHQTVCSTILSMLTPEIAAAAVVSSLATSSKRSPLEPGEEQQQPDELLAASAAAAANDTGSTSSSSNTGAPAAAQPVPAIDIAASNGSWLLPALSRAFVSLDHEFGAISEGSYVGTTAVVVLIGGSRMWVAHAGDSRAVLGRGGAVQVLTSDHKASRDDEVARVQAAGGHVWWDRVMGELAVSRAIGDHCLRPYVIPEPELLMVERTPEDEVLVMASDGLWDVMNNQEAVDMAVHSLQAAHTSGHTGVAAVKRSANALTKAALERGTRDNVTVLVIDLRPRKPGTYEAVMAVSSTHHSSRHSSSSGSRGHSSRSSKRAAAAAAAAMAAAPPAAAAAAGVASSHPEGPGTPPSSAAGVPTQEVAHNAAVAASEAAPTSAVSATPAAPDAVLPPAAAVADGVQTVPAGGVQLAGHTPSADETNSLMHPHAVGSSHGAGI